VFTQAVVSGPFEVPDELRSILKWHVYPAIGDRQIGSIRREDIKEIIATMTRKGLSASRVSHAHLVINAVFNETVRNKNLAESPCTDIPVPGIARAADFILPEEDQLEALAAGLPADWAATVWLMYGCGPRIGEALASGPAATSTRARSCGSGSRSTRLRSSVR
jgi:site-specific recombinase XerC